MKLPTRLWLSAILLSTLGLGVFSWFKIDANNPATPESAITIALGDIEENVTAQGKLEAKEFVDIGAQVTGQLKKIYVTIGDNVSAGQLLAQIDPRIYEARVRANEANIKNLQAQLAGQQAQTVFAQQQFNRNDTLLASKGISIQDYQSTEYNLKKSLATEAAIKAQIEQVQSTLQGDMTNLSFTKIFAPIASTVVDQKAREGQTLNANQQTPTILQLAKLDVMTVRAQVAEADVMRLKPGMQIYFMTLGSGERRWQASIRQILPTPEIINNVVLYNVLADVDNHDRQLMTGMSAQMFFILGRAEHVPLIPLSALGSRAPEHDDANGLAYKVKAQHQHNIQEKIIHIGLKNRRYAEIRSGLSVNDRVLPSHREDTTNKNGQNRYPGAGTPRL